MGSLAWLGSMVAKQELTKPTQPQSRHRRCTLTTSAVTLRPARLQPLRLQHPVGMVGRFGRPTGFPEKHVEFRARDFLYSQVIKSITFSHFGSWWPSATFLDALSSSTITFRSQPQTLKSNRCTLTTSAVTLRPARLQPAWLGSMVAKQELTKPTQPQSRHRRFNLQPPRLLSGRHGFNPLG